MKSGPRRRVQPPQNIEARAWEHEQHNRERAHASAKRENAVSNVRPGKTRIRATTLTARSRKTNSELPQPGSVITTLGHPVTPYVVASVAGFPPAARTELAGDLLIGLYRMRLPSRFAQQSRPLILLEIVALLGAVGVFDYNTGWEVSFSIFYGVPIFLAAWFCTRKDAYLIALLAGLIWWWADVQMEHHYLKSWHEGWQTCERLGFFLFIALGSSSLKAQANIAAARIALLEQNQKLEREIVAISEREQRRIGQDLHDGLCQYLAALGCAAAALGRELGEMRLSEQAEVADELATELQRAVIQSRDLAHGLVPVPMEEAGLNAALETLAASVTRMQGLECTFECNPDLPAFDGPAATHLYRIAQEAISNAAKHGRARTIAVSLRGNSGVPMLRIIDDGLGISKTRNRSEGVGLRIMDYRARCLGGVLQIEEKSTGGTVVSCLLPAKIHATYEDAA